MTVDVHKREGWRGPDQQNNKNYLPLAINALTYLALGWSISGATLLGRRIANATSDNDDDPMMPTAMLMPSTTRVTPTMTRVMPTRMTMTMTTRRQGWGRLRKSEHAAKARWYNLVPIMVTYKLGKLRNLPHTGILMKTYQVR